VSFNNSSFRLSFAQVTGVLRPPLSGANAVPIGKGPSKSFISRGSQEFPALRNPPKIGSVFSRLHFPRRSVFDRLGSKAGFQNSNGVSNRLFSQRATSYGGLAGPAFAQPDTVPRVVNFAAGLTNYSRVDRVTTVKCGHCKKRRAHMVRFCSSCQDLQRFIALVGSNPRANFSLTTPAPNWPKDPGVTWFKGKSLQESGPEVIGPPSHISQGDGSHSTEYTTVRNTPTSPAASPQLFQQRPPATVAPATGASSPLPESAEPSGLREMAFLNIDPELMLLPGFDRVLV
jgi:hypothetical protein